MNIQAFNEMLTRVRQICDTEFGSVRDESIDILYRRLTRVMFCIQGSMRRGIHEDAEHWFIVTSVKALRSAFHGQREHLAEGEESKLPAWPTFEEDTPVMGMIERVAELLLGVSFNRLDEHSFVLLNSRAIRQKGYRLSHIKFTEPLIAAGDDLIESDEIAQEAR